MHFLIDYCQEQAKKSEIFHKMFARTKKSPYLCIGFREERKFKAMNYLEKLSFGHREKVNRLFRLVVIDLGF